uniref:GH07363p n=1 Tax=Drosophila melanogaster TaxID=7227 RepID=Q8MT97_DROME|nr:GH07363p [Drosophila melanogaster]
MVFGQFGHHQSGVVKVQTQLAALQLIACGAKVLQDDRLLRLGRGIVVLGSQSPSAETIHRPPHECLQLGLDVHVEKRLLVINVQAGQNGLLLVRHGLDDQGCLHCAALGIAILNLSSVNVAAVVFPATRQIGQLDTDDLQVQLLQSVLQGAPEELRRKVQWWLLQCVRHRQILTLYSFPWPKSLRRSSATNPVPAAPSCQSRRIGHKTRRSWQLSMNNRAPISTTTLLPNESDYTNIMPAAPKQCNDGCAGSIFRFSSS